MSMQPPPPEPPESGQEHPEPVDLAKPAAPAPQDAFPAAWPAPVPNAHPNPATGPGPYPGGPGPYPGWQQPGPQWGPPAGGSVWGMPPGPPQAPPGQTNGQAIAAFVLGLLAVVPVSIVLGIVALVRINRTRQRGKGLAIAGLVLSAVWIVVGAGGLLLAAGYAVSHSDSASPFDPSGRPGGSEPVEELPLGSCFNQPKDQVTDLVPVVPCDGVHDRQLYARISLPGAWPGKAQAQQQSAVACAKATGTAFSDPAGLKGEAVLYTYYPNQGDWQDGDSQAWCTLASWVDGDQLLENLMTPTDYTPVQKQYLRDTVQTAELRLALSYSLPSQWQSALPLAARLAQADRAEAKALTAGHFGNAFVTGAAAAVAKDDLAEAQRAQALSQATSQDQWVTLADSVGPSSTPHIDTLRSNLDLPT